MAKLPNEKPLRLRKKHGDGTRPQVTAADGGRLVARQSERAAIMAGLIIIVVFSALWVMVAELFGTVQPWATIILGYLIGHGVRRAGKGVDWWFALIAALLSVLGSVTSSIILAASVSADESGGSTMGVLQDTSVETWLFFFAVDWNVADTAFAVFAAAVAAFYSMRRLSRDEYYALQLWRKEQSNV